MYDYFQEHELVNDISSQLGLHAENYHCFFFLKKTIKETIILCFSLMVFPVVVHAEKILFLYF